MDRSNLRQKFDRFRSRLIGRGHSSSSVDPSLRQIQSVPLPSSVDPALRQKFDRFRIERFRILIIGRANAGKTTILQRVCNTQENPEIYNSTGEKCGEHDIENEMVFRSNPGFVFHDSRKFEAGGQSKFDTVKEFIADRSTRTNMNGRTPFSLIVLQNLLIGRAGHAKTLQADASDRK
ncbi:uncharacterized protein EDB91DRAFT_1335536 [Suillus paluster]|uniref:uncharacterized protein n=1 Tax=Suillus paluster TaxID=48578 RepID=UPI001B87BC80|nr:uncharacterized protein EDB91DRAFT_1335536 [Suillus paluster]KAG1744533.1 hypothetical protein EDB91DRAFT_1335536 [Suillus paluster]